MNRTEKNDLCGYAFVRNQVVHTGVIPSLREIGRAVGYTSPRSVQLMLIRLQKRGLLRCSAGTIVLSSKKFPSAERTVNVPLVGSVSCGTPSLAEQEPEVLIPVSIKIARPGSSYFLLRAVGTSMNRAGINDGDLLLVRQQSVAEEGEKVVALINDEATVKRFHQQSDVIILRPDSTDAVHQPIVLSEDFLIQGVVVAVLPSNLY